MPTNEERREIAAAIREYAKAWESTPPLDAIELDDDERQAVAFEILDLLGVDFEKVEKTSSCYRIVSDLIEPEHERTCEIVTDDIDRAHCSLCGYEYDYHDGTGIGCIGDEEEYEFEYDGNFCKNCGAKVINNANQ